MTNNNLKIAPFSSSRFNRIKAAAAATVGVGVPLLYIMKKQKTINPFKLNYGLSDLVILSTSSVASSIVATSLGEKNDVIKKKCEEGTFQLLNIMLPAILTSGSSKLCANIKKLNNIPSKLISVALSLFIGMFGALKISNFINDPKDKVPDRKLVPKDYLTGLDDAMGAISIVKLPVKFHFDKIIPLFYTYCGYRVGNTR